MEDLFSRGDVDVVSGTRRTLVTGLMKAVSLGLPQMVQVRPVAVASALCV